MPAFVIPNKVRLIGRGDPRDVDTLYEVFVRDFVQFTPCHDELPLVYDDRIIDGKENMFWHLTHVHQKHGNDGVFDFGRAVRLSWIRPMIEASVGSGFKKFDYEEDSGKVRRYLWLTVHKFVVVLQREKPVTGLGTYRLISAHYLDFAGRDQQMRKKYNSCLRKQKNNRPQL